MLVLFSTLELGVLNRRIIRSCVIDIHRQGIPVSGKTPAIVMSSVIILSTLLSAALSYERSLPIGSPVGVVSVKGPVPPYTPGGPAVAIVVQDVSNIPVTDLTAILYLSSGSGGLQFTFGISASNPLMPGQTAQATRILIGGGFDSSQSYPLRINSMLQNGAEFSYLLQVQIAPPG